MRAKQQALEAVRQELGRATDAGTRTKLEQEETQRGPSSSARWRRRSGHPECLQRQISNDLMAKVRPILEELVAGTDVQIVLQSDGPILWAAPGLDLTPVVVERLNAGAGRSWGSEGPRVRGSEGPKVRRSEGPKVRGSERSEGVRGSEGRGAEGPGAFRR